MSMVVHVKLTFLMTVILNFQEADLEIATQLNNQDYEESGQAIECGCCYGSYPFEEMVQCFEGHLFCTDCLKRYKSILFKFILVVCSMLLLL